MRTGNLVRFEQEQKIIAEIQSALSSMQAALPMPAPGTKAGPEFYRQFVLYASAAVTGGFNLYRLYLKYQVKSVDELNAIDPQIYKEQVFNRNVREGIKYGQALQRNTEYKHVIVPGVFFAKGWLQKHYWAFWDSVVYHWAGQIAMKEHWYYSVGQAREFVQALRYSRPILDHTGKKLLNPDRELKLFDQAINNLEKIGADTENLISSFRDIKLCVDNPLRFIESVAAK